MFFSRNSKNMQENKYHNKDFLSKFDVCKNFLKKWEKAPLSGVTLAASASGIKMQGCKILSVFFSLIFTQQGHVMYHVAAASYALKFLKMSESIITWRTNFSIDLIE